MAEKVAAKKLPTASVALLGSGIMHWSKDKQIDVVQGRPSSKSSLSSTRSSMTFSALISTGSMKIDEHDA